MHLSNLYKRDKEKNKSPDKMKQYNLEKHLNLRIDFLVWRLKPSFSCKTVAQTQFMPTYALNTHH